MRFWLQSSADGTLAYLDAMEAAERRAADQKPGGGLKPKQPDASSVRFARRRLGTGLNVDGCIVYGGRLKYEPGCVNRRPAF